MASPSGLQTWGVSQNTRFYAQKMPEQRAARDSKRPLGKQLDEILNFVRQCEMRWDLDRRRWWDWLRTMTSPAIQSRPPLRSSVHIVNGMSENSTSAPKMHMAAAPARRNDPGSSSHAEYQGGGTTSPRSDIRATARPRPALLHAGAVRASAQRMWTSPALAATTGCTPAMASPAATAKPRRRRSALGCGISNSSTGESHIRHRRRLVEDRLRRDGSDLHVLVMIGPRELGEERIVASLRSRHEFGVGRHAAGVRLARQAAGQVGGCIEVVGPVHGGRRVGIDRDAKHSHSPG